MFWDPVRSLLNDWLGVYSTLNIMVGSVLDANRDGLRDSDSSYPNFTDGVAVPSHFFVVVTRCGLHGVELGACPVEDLQVLGMLFQSPLETGVSGGEGGGGGGEGREVGENVEGRREEDEGREGGREEGM